MKIKKAVARIVFVALLSGLLPAAAFGDAGVDVYSSTIVPPTYSVNAQNQPLERNGSGGEFTLVLLDNTEGFPTYIYVASNRPYSDYFYYQLGATGEWIYIGGGQNSAQAIRISTMSELIVGSSRIRELRLKVVSTEGGTSYIAFGVDASCAFDYARNRSLDHDESHIIQQNRYPVDYTASSYSGGTGSTTTNINPYQSVVVSPGSPVAAQVLPLNRYNEGAEFTLTITGNSSIGSDDKIYVASSRPNADYLYYRLGNGDWQPFQAGNDRPLSSVAVLTPFTHSSSISSTIHELRLKIVSTAEGISDIVFGIDPVDVSDYAAGRFSAQSNRLGNIIGQRKFVAEFSAPSGSPGNSNNISVNRSSVSAPDQPVSAQIPPLSRDGSGAEFTLTLTGNASLTANDRIYVASSRPGTDYLYYRLGSGDWQPFYSGGDIPITSMAALVPFTHSTSLSNVSHELRLKIVSTAEGISQIVFGTNAQDTLDYALGRTLSSGLSQIVGQRSYNVTFTTPVSNIGQMVEGLRAEAIGTGVKLRWTPLTGSAGYRLYRADSANGDATSLTDVGIITGTEFVDVNVRPNTTYYYSLRQVIKEANASTRQFEELGPMSARIALTTASSIVGEYLNPSGLGAGKKFLLMTLNSVQMNANGVIKEIDPGRGTAPLLINDRTMVPVRAVTEEIGGSAGWYAATREITLQAKNNTVLMWLDNTEIRVNETRKTMDVAPVSINDRTMVPLRFAAENLGCEVEWLGSPQQIVVVYY